MIVRLLSSDRLSSSFIYGRVTASEVTLTTSSTRPSLVSLLGSCSLTRGGRDCEFGKSPRFCLLSPELLSLLLRNSVSSRQTLCAATSTSSCRCSILHFCY